MTVYLMKRHLTGLLVTPTSLARAADVPYTTAVRRIEQMRTDGLLSFRPRTRSGRSFSVHPSQSLIESTFAYAEAVKGAIAKVLGQRPGSNSFYLGASYLSARIIPGPTVVTDELVVGQTLDVLMHNDPSFFVQEKLQQEIAHLLGGKVRFHGVPFDDVRLTTLDNSRQQRSAYDIVAVDLPWVGEYARDGILMHLDELVADGSVDRADFHPAGWEGTHVNGKQYALPLLTNPEVLFYRRDMLDACGVAPPTTTDELLQAVRELHAPRHHCYGITWTGARGTPVGQAFIQFLADFGQPMTKVCPSP